MSVTTSSTVGVGEATAGYVIKPRRIRIGAACVALLLIAGGCGGSAPAESEQPEAPSITATVETTEATTSTSTTTTSTTTTTTSTTTTTTTLPPPPWTVEELNLAIGPAATAWLQSGAASQSPEALALRDAAKAVFDTQSVRPFPPELNRDPNDMVRPGYYIEGLAGCTIDCDSPIIFVEIFYRALYALNLNLPDLGTLLFPGNYTVGEDIQPGTYQTLSDVEDCYWETLDAAGELNDNNFVNAAPQVQMTVRSSDFAVNVESECGIWRLQ